MITFGIKLNNCGSIWLWNDIFGSKCNIPMFQSPVCPPPLSPPHLPGDKGRSLRAYVILECSLTCPCFLYWLLVACISDDHCISVTPERLGWSAEIWNNNTISDLGKNKMRKYKETSSTSLPNYTSSTMTMSSRSFTSMNSREGSPKVKDLTKWLHLSRTKLPLSSINKQERGRNSQWTKLRHSLDFIRKSKELLETNKSEKIETTRTLTFLGQIYCLDNTFKLELDEK